MRAIGIVLVVAGIVWGVVAFNMDTTVTTAAETFGSGDYTIKVPSQTVHNLGLLERRRNHLMLAGLSLLAGVLLVGFGSAGRKRGDADSGLVPCPMCAELIQPAALKCRYCGSDVAREPVGSQQRSKSDAVALDERFESQIGLIEQGTATYETYADVIKSLGGSIVPHGFRGQYFITYDGRQTRVDGFEALQQWFSQNVGEGLDD